MEEHIRKIIHCATLAPSGYNTQPWKFSVRGDEIVVLPDYSRRLPVVDPDDHALFISLGCALENLVIAAHCAGHGASVEYVPSGPEPERIRVRVGGERGECPAELFQAIPDRQATRSAYDGRPIPAEHWEELERAGTGERVSVIRFTEARDIEPIIGFVREGNILQFRNKAFVDELIRWIRFSKKDARAARDGLNSASMGMPSVPNWLGTIIIRLFATPGGEARKCEKRIRSSSGLLLFVAKDNDRRSWIDVGRGFERTALRATALGIRHAHVNMPCEEIEIRNRLRNHLGLKDGHPLLLLRMGYSDPMPGSYRRPVEDVVIET